MLRRLNHIEEAFTLSNERYPLCVCIALRLRNGPSTIEFQDALDNMQSRHLLLQSRIDRRWGRYVFDRLEGDVQIPLKHVQRTGDSDWERALEEELNTRYDPSGPLLRAVHVAGAKPEAELILVLHHAIMDGVSARLLLHELLCLSNGEPLEPPLSEREQLAQHAFPAAFRGLRLAAKIAPFMIGQFWEDVRYDRRGLVAPVAAGGYNRIKHLIFPADVSRRINYRIGREGLSLNSVINAAILLSVRRRLHRGASKSWMRAISFADLRPFLEPAPSEAVLGCMISMLRFSVPVWDETSLLDVAHELRREIYRGGKAGSPFLVATLSKVVTRMLLLRGGARMSSSALSFLGKLDLRPRYGDTQLYEVHAFITNNVVGPELSGFGKVFLGRIELDLTYLSSEISETTANELLSEIEVLLRDLSS